MTIFLDTTRLFTRLLRSAPTGIDRVEFAFARHLSRQERSTPVAGIVTTPFLNGAFETAVLRDHVAAVDGAWGNAATGASVEAFARKVRAAIEAPHDATRQAPLRLRRERRTGSAVRLLRFPAAHIAGASLALTRRLRTTRGAARAYLHTSHTQLDSPRRFEWLTRNDIPAVFFVHDTIPLDYPEFCSPGSASRHLTRLETVAGLADVVIVNSQATRHSLLRHIDPVRWPKLRIEIVPLAVEAAFHRSSEPEPANRTPYFLAIGTIEPRKNLLFLLALWRELVRRHGERTPRLVIAGRRGWENEMILDVLDRSALLAPHVIEVSGLPDGELARLMRGATAVLAPSDVEGFGLPVAEALACGTAVMASDIPAHREVAGAHAELLHPLDGNGWLSAIERLCDPRETLRASLRDKAHAYRPLKWEAHVEAAMAIVSDVARPARIN